jgi:hypothetical protein
MTLDSLISPEAVSLYLIALFICVWAIHLIARTPKKASLRVIPGLQRLLREVSVAVESGKRVHVSLGRGGLFGYQGASAFMGLTILKRILRVAQKGDRPPLTTAGEANLVMLADSVNQKATEENKAVVQTGSGLNQLSGMTPFSYVAGALQAIHDEQVTVNVLAGHFGSEAALLLDTTGETDSLTLAGSDNLTAQAVIYPETEQALIGEDLYAAGGYLQSGKQFIASLHAQDFIRWMLILVLITGAVLKLLGIL